MGLMDRLSGREARTADVIPMPVTNRAQSVPYSSDRALTASAEKIDLKKKSNVHSLQNRPYAEWQRDAWEFYDAIGEIKYAFTLLSAVFSRLRLYPALVLDPDAPPQSTTMVKRRDAGQTDEERETDERDQLKPPSDVSTEVMDYMESLVTSLGTARGGIPGLLRTFALNQSVAGECYLCYIDNRWSFRSTEEITIRDTDSKAVLREMRSTANRVTTGSPLERVLPDNTYIGRIWKPHPRYSKEPDSSMLGLRELCDELLTLQRMIRIVARRKMNAGLVFIPDSISAASTSVTEDVEEAELEADPFEQEFIQSLIAPIGDEASAATVAPMVARGPGEDGSKILHVTFDTPADQQLVERADRALERIMQGIDIPKDIITGLANVKYSNAVQIDESLYKSHVEPLALVLVDALTTIYLRPALKAKFKDIAEESLNKLVIWYDPTEVVTKPDPANAAKALYDNYEISGDAYRRAYGFADTDKPDESEIANRMAIEKATLPPEIVTALVKHLLPAVFKEQQQQNLQGDGNRPPMPDSAREMLFPEGDQTTTPEAPGAVSDTAAPEASSPSDASFPGQEDSL